MPAFMFMPASVPAVEPNTLLASSASSLQLGLPYRGGGEGGEMGEEKGGGKEEKGREREKGGE